MFSGYLSASGADILYLAAGLVLFVGGLYLLVRLQQRHVKFGTRVFAGLGLGIVLGLILQLAFTTHPSALKVALS